MQTPSAVPGYRPEIDGLRALAVGMVVLYHTGLGCPGGFVGVDVFFVISGYLITSLIVRDLAAGTFSLGRFYERRVRRILPASIAVTVVVLAVGYFDLLPLDLESLGLSAVAHAGCAANFFFYARTANYFAASAATMPLLHLWSLAAEEQFYCVFPLLLMACWRMKWLRSRGSLAGVIGVLLLGSLAWSIAAVSSDPMSAFFLLPARAWELMAGAMLAVLPPLRGPRAVREIAAIAAVAAMVTPAAIYSTTTAFPGLAALPPCLGAALFIAAGRGRQGDEPAFVQALVGRLFATRGPVFIGAISYSLYLVHWPVAVFSRYWAVTPLSVPNRLAQVALSVALAVLSWQWIERPFRQRRAGATRRSLFAAAVVGLATIAIIGGAFDAAGGVPSRFSAAVNACDAARRVRPELAQLRAADIVADRLTFFGNSDPNKPLSVLLWGDSHADAARPAFDAVCKTLGIRGASATHSSVTPLLDYANDPVLGRRRAAIAFNCAVLDCIARRRVQTVFLVSYWSRDLQGDTTAFETAMGKTLAALHALGVQTYVLLQVPGYEVDVPKAVANELIHRRPVPGWRETMADHRRLQAVMDRLAAKYAAPDCRFIDPAPVFVAPGDAFLAVAAEGRPLYGDTHHLTAWAAKRMLGPLIENVLSNPLSRVITGEG